MPLRLKHHTLTLISLILLGVFDSNLSFSAEPDAAIEKGKPNSPAEYWLGVICHPVKKTEKTRNHVKNGLFVEEVIANSPASKAGIVAGDILMEYSNHDLKKVDDLMAQVATSQEPDVVLLVMRKGKERSLHVTLAKRPADLDVDRLDGPAQETFANEADMKKRLLIEAAKGAMAQLHAVKAREDAERKESQLMAAHAEGTSVAIGKLSEGGTIGGAVRHAGVTRSLDPKSLDNLPEQLREHVHSAYRQIEGERHVVKKVDHQQLPDATDLRLEDLENRINTLDRKLDELLDLLKTSRPKAKK